MFSEAVGVGATTGDKVARQLFVPFALKISGTTHVRQ